MLKHRGMCLVKGRHSPAVRHSYNDSHPEMYNFNEAPSAKPGRMRGTTMAATEEGRFGHSYGKVIASVIV